MSSCKEEKGECEFPCPYTRAFACGNTFPECFNDFNCTLDRPFRCNDGQCMRYPMQLGKNATYDSMACKMGVKCPR
ncbi:MAG: hypothetical protein MJ252_06100 [archaeon]|nr:hypothetical protein [archaeon]